MKLNAKFIKLLPLLTGESTNGNWSKQEFIVETKDNYPKRIVITNWNDQSAIFNLKENESYDFEITAESKLFNGNYYSTLVLNGSPVTTNAPISAPVSSFQPFNSALKIIEFLPESSGTSWSKKELVFEPLNNTGKRFSVSFINNKIDLTGFSIGDEVLLGFYAESREHNQRWFTEFKAWKIELTLKYKTENNQKFDDSDPNNWPF